jgi:uncharacterized protein with FMN-binding domain
MKYLTCIALAAVLIFACAGLKTGNVDFFEGAAMGYRGMIHVRVGMENGAITEINVVESGEDPAVGGAAIEELTDLVLMYNTTELDAVSGATETSRGFLEAVENAIFSP